MLLLSLTFVLKTYYTIIKDLVSFTPYYSARNKDQKLVGHFFEDRIFYRLLIAVLLIVYRKFGRPKWILVGQMLKLVGKWPMADCYF